MAEKQKTHSWLIIGVVTLSIINIALFVWMLIHQTGKTDLCEKITVENWFSYLVTLIGVIVTIFVGLQIYNTVEAKRAMKDAEEKFDNLKNRTEEALSAFRNEFNELKINLLERQYEVAKRVDWDLKEVKKEYWSEITNMKEIVKSTAKTQVDINTDMNVIKEKWGNIQKDQDVFSKKMSDYKHDLANAFLQISKTFGDDNLLKVLTGLKSINLREDFSGENINILIRLLDKFINILEENNKKPCENKENIVQEAHDLQKTSIDSQDKHYFEIREKMFKIARLAEQLPDLPEKDEKFS